MKPAQLKINTPCLENLEQMKPRKKGYYCDVCSKDVLDLTKLNSNEIIKLINQSNKEICGILTQEQLNTPILYFEPQKSTWIPQVKITAGLFILAALFNPQPLIGQDVLYTPYSSTPFYLTPLVNKGHTYIEKQIPTPIKTIPFKGQVNYVDSYLSAIEERACDEFFKYDSIAVEHAKIELITLEGIYTTYSDKKGNYTLDIPLTLLKKKNIIRVSYDSIAMNLNVSKGYTTLRTKNYIIKDIDIENPFTIIANRSSFYLGGIGSHLFYNRKTSIHLNKDTPLYIPIILYNGIEINFLEHSRTKRRKNNRYNLANKNVYYFNSHEAQILFGPRAQFGLFYYFD